MVTNLFLRTLGISKAHKEEIWPGKWIAEDRWPSANVQHHEFALQNDRGLALTSEIKVQSTSKEPIESKVSVKSSCLSGSWGGLLFAYGLEDLPVEQGVENALSECWETTTLKEPIAVVGFPEVHLQLSCDRPCALVAARLCDVFPDGESALITRGMYIIDYYRIYMYRLYLTIVTFIIISHLLLEMFIINSYIVSVGF